MRAKIAILGASVLSCTTLHAIAAPCILALNSQIYLQPDTGLIDARIDDQPVAFEFDTGSFTTVLTPAAVSRLKLRPDPDKSEHFRGQPDSHFTMIGVGGERVGDEVMARTFDVGALHGHNFHFLTAELGLPKVDGLLGTDFFNYYDIDLDVPDHQVRFYRAIGACSRPKIFLDPPLYTVPFARTDEDKRPLVKVNIEGKSFLALIDTGASYNVMFRGAAAQFGLQPGKPGNDSAMTLKGIGPSLVNATKHVFATVTIGDLTVRNMSMAISGRSSDDDIDVLLGADFQRLMHLWISNSSNTLVMQFPPQPSPRLK